MTSLWQLEHVHGYNYTLPCSNVNANYYGNLQAGPALKVMIQFSQPREATKSLYITNRWCITYVYIHIHIHIYIYIYISISSYIQFRYFMQTSFEIGGFRFFRWYPMIAYFVPSIRLVEDFVVRVVPIFNDRFGPCFLRPSAIPRKCTSCFLNLNSHALIGSILKEVTVPISYVWVTCMQLFL